MPWLSYKKNKGIIFEWWMCKKKKVTRWSSWPSWAWNPDRYVSLELLSRILIARAVQTVVCALSLLFFLTCELTLCLFTGEALNMGRSTSWETFKKPCRIHYQSSKPVQGAQVLGNQGTLDLLFRDQYGLDILYDFFIGRLLLPPFSWFSGKILIRGAHPIFLRVYRIWTW
jgi:hypothetical protein